jgi:hypothetical protein
LWNGLPICTCAALRLSDLSDQKWSPIFFLCC